MSQNGTDTDAARLLVQLLASACTGCTASCARIGELEARVLELQLKVARLQGTSLEGVDVAELNELFTIVDGAHTKVFAARALLWAKQLDIFRKPWRGQLLHMTYTSGHKDG